MVEGELHRLYIRLSQRIASCQSLKVSESSGFVPSWLALRLLGYLRAHGAEHLAQHYADW